jgi:hypothetical protein
MHGRRVGLFARQRHKQSEGGGALSPGAPRRAQDNTRHRMTGRDFQNFICLFCCKARVRSEQALGMGQRRIDRGGLFDCDR